MNNVYYLLLQFDLYIAKIGHLIKSRHFGEYCFGNRLLPSTAREIK